MAKRSTTATCAGVSDSCVNLIKECSQLCIYKNSACCKHISLASSRRTVQLCHCILRFLLSSYFKTTGSRVINFSFFHGQSIPYVWPDVGCRTSQPRRAISSPISSFLVPALLLKHVPDYGCGLGGYWSI